MPAPSRPLRVAPAPPGEPAVAALPMVDRIALATQLAHALSSEELAVLVQFVEDRRDGTLVLTREGGRISEITAVRAPRPRRAVSSG